MRMDFEHGFCLCCVEDRADVSRRSYGVEEGVFFFLCR